MNIAVIGLGLIGGSIAKCIKKLTPHTVLGADTSEQVLYKAKLLEAIDGELTGERLAICDMVIVATMAKGSCRLRDHPRGRDQEGRAGDRRVRREVGGL